MAKTEDSDWFGKDGGRRSDWVVVGELAPRGTETHVVSINWASFGVTKANEEGTPADI